MDGYDKEKEKRGKQETWKFRGQDILTVHCFIVLKGKSHRFRV